MTAPVGAVVKLFIDTIHSVWEGDYIQTQTGRTYLVQSVRVQTKGIHQGRQHLTVMVVPEDSTQVGDTVIPIRWYRR